MTHEAAEAVKAGRLAFGKRVRALRAARGLSQERLAELAEVHRTYMSSIERGQRNVGLDNILALAKALDVSPGAFFEEADS